MPGDNSISALAASLLQTSPNEGNEENNETVVEEEDDVVDDQGVDGEEEEGEDIDGDELEDDEPEGGDPDLEDDDQPAGLDVADDDMIEVKVDGKVKTFTIAQAKKALSGEGAIEARLKEATETRKAAHAERTMFLDQFAMAQSSLVNTLTSVEDVMFQPAVKRPDAALRQSNPTAYLQHLEAYEADQARVNEGKKQFKAVMTKQQEALQKDVAAYRADQAAKIVEAIPQLGEPTTAQPLMSEMARLAIEHYGYSQNEIQMASDHRMYRMMYDALQYRKLLAGGKKVDKERDFDAGKQKDKRPRVLRSGTTSTARKTSAVKQAERAKEVTTNARKTGKVADVAQTLLR